MFSSGVSPRTYRAITYVAVAGVAFQVAHFIEHLAQLGYWFLHPLEAPFLTPWAVMGRDMLSSTAVTGAELLHLLGNTIFLVALIAMCMVLACRQQSINEKPYLKKAIMWQGFHVVEHVTLTATWLIFGKVIGVSTLFGLVGPGPLMSSYRVWWHFLINLIATIYATRALKQFADERLLFPDAAAPSPA